jgi:hypothetical protein
MMAPMGPTDPMDPWLGSPDMEFFFDLHSNTAL